MMAHVSGLRIRAPDRSLAILHDHFLLLLHARQVAALKRETSGKLRRAMLTWVSSSDPVHAE